MMSNNQPVEQFAIVEDTNSSTSIPLHLQTIQIGRLRKRLILLLSLMFAFSFVYLSFLGISCIQHLSPWLCQYFNHQYEFVWACLSLIFDGLWIIFAYQYYSKGLRLFAALSLVFLMIFVAFLVLALLGVGRLLANPDHFPEHVVIFSLISILNCIGTLILQIVITLFSFKLSKFITKSRLSTTTN